MEIDQDYFYLTPFTTHEFRKKKMNRIKAGCLLAAPIMYLFGCQSSEDTYNGNPKNQPTVENDSASKALPAETAPCYFLRAGYSDSFPLDLPHISTVTISHNGDVEVIMKTEKEPHVPIAKGNKNGYVELVELGTENGKGKIINSNLSDREISRLRRFVEISKFMTLNKSYDIGCDEGSTYYISIQKVIDGKSVVKTVCVRWRSMADIGDSSDSIQRFFSLWCKIDEYIPLVGTQVRRIRDQLEE